MKESGRAGRGGKGVRVRNGLAVTQLALALTLLAFAGLLVKSFERVQGVEPGIRPENLWTLSVNVPVARYPPPRQPLFFDGLVGRAVALPGVQSAAVSSMLPFSGNWDRISVEVEGRPLPRAADWPEGDRYIVSPGYFSTMQIGLKAGRVLEDADRPDAPPVAVVDEVFARRLSPEGSPNSIAALPGIRSVSAAELSTLTGDDSGGNITLEGVDPKPSASTHVLENWVGPSYFATLGIPVLAGRDLSWRDDGSAPKVAVVNEAFVSRFAGGKSALGQRFHFGRKKALPPFIEIVGVVKNSKASQVAEAERPFVYLPYLQDENLGELTIYVRSVGEPLRLAQSLRAAVARLDAQLPIFGIKTLDQQVKDSLVTQRLIVLLSASFAALAGLLAAIGIYGVLAFAVAQRRQEIGVRVALGADPASVRRMILGEVGRFLAIGGLIGLPAAYALARTARSLLYGIGAAEPSIFAIGVALMAGVALAAAYPSAHRAARTNPMDALRSE